MSVRAAVARVLLLGLRVGMGGLFVVAGVLKLRDPAGFAQEIANYQLAPALAPYVAIVLPAIEIVAGLSLVALPGPWRRAGAATLAALLAGFTVAVLAAVLRGVNIDCGCFGTGSGAVGWGTVVRNVVLLATALVLARRS